MSGTVDSPPTPGGLAELLIDENLRRGFADRTAIVTAAASFSYGALADRVHRAANAFVAAGITRGDRVMTMLPDGIDFVTALLGTLKCGAVAVMGNPELPAVDQVALIKHAGARAVITTAKVAARLSSAAGGVAWFTIAPLTNNHDGAANERDFHRALAAQPARFSGLSPGPDDDAMWLFSSGSTGRPKAAIHRHKDFSASIDLYARGVLGLHADDITFAGPRLYFPYATGMNLFFPLAVGARAVLCENRPAAADVYTWCREHKVTVLSLVPTLAAKMLDLADAIPDGAHLPAVRLAISAGEALPAPLYQRFRARHGVELLDALGSAEMFHVYVTNRPGHSVPGCLGRAVPGYEVKIVCDPDRDTGKAAAPGTMGTLWVRGPSAARGYHGDPAASAATFRPDGWVVTGDAFAQVPDGALFFHGRTDDLMKVGGIYVSPHEIEDVLRTHPAVADCAVAGHPDEQGLEKPRAYLVLHEGHTAGDTLFAALTEFVRAQLAHYKVPRFWTVLPTLPRNDRGKVVRRTLRER